MNECLHCILILNRVASLAVKEHLRNIAKNLQDLQNSIGEIDGRSRRDFEQVHGSLGSIHDGQKDILRSHEDSRAREESQTLGNHLSDIIF